MRMRRSTDPILVSHAGTLPRPDDVAHVFADGPDDELEALVEGARLATRELWGG
jgi:hypothetical protein